MRIFSACHIETKVPTRYRKKSVLFSMSLCDLSANFQYPCYTTGGGYQLFAGKDVSRALAKMSFKDEDVNSADISDLNEAQMKTLMDWEKKFIEVRKYPIVGSIVEN